MIYANLRFLPHILICIRELAFLHALLAETRHPPIKTVLVPDCVCMLLIHDPSAHAAGRCYLYTNYHRTRTAIKHSVGKLVESSPRKRGQPRHASIDMRRQQQQQQQCISQIFRAHAYKQQFNLFLKNVSRASISNWCMHTCSGSPRFQGVGGHSTSFHRTCLIAVLV